MRKISLFLALIMLVSMAAIPAGAEQETLQQPVVKTTTKKIIEVDYRNLPQKTRKEKKYYEKARMRDGRRRKRQLYNLLDCISRGETPANKWVSIC